ncbi:predicted protein [Chaetoceros tenuissimus]|uniref:Uncharacterized protein n=1 Tax=Chaetoceros tenuissimus TaxID=426638 RepID=A0AAD3DD05_9STRA|nr:predicted protein [Chaetoceros tenuissimus]
MLQQKQVELQRYQAGIEFEDKLLFWLRLQFKLQMEYDYWFEMVSYPNVQPADLPNLNAQGVFQSIRLHARWEPAIGSHYLEQLGLNAVPLVPAPTAGGTQSTDDTSGCAENRTISNPTFNADLFNQYREDTATPAQVVRSRWETAGVQLPRSCVDANKPMCFAYLLLFMPQH